MFIIFYAKTMAIIFSYLILIFTFITLVLYMRQFTTRLRIKNKKSTPKVIIAAKAIVFSANFAALLGSTYAVMYTIDWQKQIGNGLANSISHQPMLLFLVIPIIAYPMISLRQLAMSIDK